jgi:hypothetical protein
VAFGILFALRIDAEERMMLEAVGDEYAAYMAKTKLVKNRVTASLTQYHQGLADGRATRIAAGKGSDRLLKHPTTGKEVWVAVHTKKDEGRLGNRILREAGIE